MNEDQVIFPSFQSLYYWSFENSENDKITIKIEYTPEFNAKCLNILVSENKEDIRVEIPDHVPIILGRLFSKISDYQIEYNTDKLIISLIKTDNTLWPRLIGGPWTGTQLIDPKSAFEIVSSNDPSYSESEHEALLVQSLTQRYIPAILSCADKLENSPEERNYLLQLLEVASYKYHNPIAYFKLASLHNELGNRQLAYRLYSQAAQGGIIIALSLMGQILSPLSGVEYEEKNAITALEIFEQVLSIKDEPIALYEAAKLYLSGTGVPKDVSKANDYYIRAKKLAPSLPELPKEKGFGSLAYISIGASLAFAGYYFYRRFRK